MRRKTLLLLCLALLLSLCAACSRQSGWLYDLPNGYAIRCADGKVDVTQNGEQALAEGVAAFCVGERFVGIQQTCETDDGKTERNWFLLDTENSVFYTSANEEEYIADCESFGVTDLGDWIPTDKAPSGSHAA